MYGEIKVRYFYEVLTSLADRLVGVHEVHDSIRWVMVAYRVLETITSWWRY